MAKASSPGAPLSWRRRTPIFALLVVGFGLVLARALWPTSDPTPQLPFSIEAWRAPSSSQGNWSPRRAMLDDLLRRHPLVGMKRADVERLLGPPEHEPWSDLYPGAGYALGLPHPGGFGDSDNVPLLLYYDANGVVREVRVF